MTNETRRAPTLRRERLIYAAAFAGLVLLEVFIALFVRDSFIRPYGGDIIIVVVLYCLVRIFFPRGIRLLPLYLLLFAAAVEAGQYFRMVELLGLADNRFFSVLMGTSFSHIDLLCYAAGSLVCFGCEAVCGFFGRRQSDKDTKTDR